MQCNAPGDRCRLLTLCVHRANGTAVRGYGAAAVLRSARPANVLDRRQRRFSRLRPAPAVLLFIRCAVRAEYGSSTEPVTQRSLKQRD